MLRLNQINRDRDTVAVMVELTGAFEGIASLHISDIKDQVQSSQKFFADLWSIYSQIRVDPLFHFGRGATLKPIKKELFVLITAEGSFSGDIDQRLINLALANYKPEKNDLAVVGQHGATQLASRNIPYVANFKLPARDVNINPAALVAQIQKYESTVIYYPSYVSLTNQQVHSMHLSSEVAERGKSLVGSKEVISEATYIFEPSVKAVVDHLEQSMVQIMLGELIMESKLAQYASRFWAMHSARSKAGDSLEDLNTLLKRTKRYYKDERTREIVNGLRKGGKL